MPIPIDLQADHQAGSNRLKLARPGKSGFQKTRFCCQNFGQGLSGRREGHSWVVPRVFARVNEERARPVKSFGPPVRNLFTNSIRISKPLVGGLQEIAKLRRTKGLRGSIPIVIRAEAAEIFRIIGSAERQRLDMIELSSVSALADFSGEGISVLALSLGTLEDEAFDFRRESLSKFFRFCDDFSKSFGLYKFSLRFFMILMSRSFRELFRFHL